MTSKPFKVVLRLACLTISGALHCSIVESGCHLITLSRLLELPSERPLDGWPSALAFCKTNSSVYYTGQRYIIFLLLFTMICRDRKAAIPIEMSSVGCVMRLPASSRDKANQALVSPDCLDRTSNSISTGERCVVPPS
ncbi:hypothetical protein C8Q69DRAFT_107120 [Paecilomyces variotii]|uniref:Secreted protein n=1 Tax=Byssochlamys spectabilis TaxID=264951 RepID=A0A443HK42_BYSSP|nr:hypothetical protein C8Q69DRAFT_107120 [Paecilomyces variotii]RWQ92222.1 hypothetical protein C8Q69DRAFT_107120 [Paecilomyces variotii]